jgi:hypothetical protein
VFAVAGNVCGDALGEELAHQICADATGEADGGIGEDEVRATICFGVIEIGESARRHVAEQIGRIEHSAATIIARKKRGGDGVREAGLDGAGALVVVARVLVEKRGKDGVSEEVAGAPVDKFSGKTFAVARGALSVAGIGVCGLLDAGGDGDAEHGHRIECAARGEREFLFRGERGGVIDVAGIEIWEETDETLLFFGPDLLGGDEFGGTDGHFHAGRRERQRDVGKLVSLSNGDGELRRCEGRKTFCVDGNEVGAGRNFSKSKFAAGFGDHGAQRGSVFPRQADVRAGNGGAAYVQHGTRDAGFTFRMG